MSLLQKYIKPVIIAAIAVVACVLAWTFFLNPSRKLRIDETTSVVTKVRRIGELTTICFYDEVVLREKKADKFSSSKLGEAVNSKGKDNLVLIAKGELKAGFDLTQICNEDIRISEDSLFVTLPEAKVLDVICNPSDIEVYVETGKWTHDQAVAAEVKVKDKIQEDAVDMKILEKASESGVIKLGNLLKALGYGHVAITVR